MSSYRHRLPQLKSGLFLTDGGIETDLVFNQKIELPHFATFTLLFSKEGRDRLWAYYSRYAEIARVSGTGFILESPTWRSSADWGARLGYSPAALARANRAAISLMEDLRSAYQSPVTPIVISGCIGPRGEGTLHGHIMSPGEARAYHATQVSTFAETSADLVSAITMTSINEAIGICQAARAVNIPVVISFSLETDGCLRSGQSLAEAIEQTDHATGRTPAYYMINCAHPDHFESTLAVGGQWIMRVRGIRANASRCSHAELNYATELDTGDPQELGRQYARLLRRHPHLSLVGGCCGTDHRHLLEIAYACSAAA